MSLLGLDVGTTGTKASVFDREGQNLAAAYREYPLLTPGPGRVELDPERVWRLVCEAVAEAAAQVSSDPVQALAISTLGEAAVPVDEHGNALAHAILGFDSRAEDLFAEWMHDRDPARIMSITGQPPSQVFTLAKLMWIARNQPELHERMHRYACFGDFLQGKMGLDPRTDYSMAARTMAFDINELQYSGEICRAAGVDPELFTPAAPTGTPVGTLGAQAADALGLPPGCLVATGSHDQPAGALGCAVTQPGLIMDATGTVECFAAAQDEPVVNEVMLESNLQCYPAASPGTYVCLAFNYTGGSLLRWARDELGEAERAEARRAGRDVYDLLTEEMADQPTDLFVLPHMTATGTPHMDPDPVGAVVGLSVSTTRAQLLRAVIEGVSYEMKLNLDYLERAGAELERFRAIGGAARNDFWLQLKADMYGRPVEKMAVSEAASLGMAISAGVAAEVYEDAAETAAALTKPLQTFEPNPENARYYDERLEEYRELYPALKNWRESTGYRT